MFWIANTRSGPLHSASKVQTIKVVLPRKNLSELGFAWNQYVVMRNIQPGESVTLSEISAKSLKENSNVTALVDFLESKGIVRRVHDSNDRRVVRVELTEEGIQTRQHVMQEHQKFIKKLFQNMNEDELKGLIKILEVFDEKIRM